MTEGDLLDSWPLGAGAPLPRFLRFFAALEARGQPETRPPEEGPGWTEESLGAFNRRLARLHGRLIGRPVEARVTCACGDDLEVALPLAAVASAPDPAPRVEIDAEGPRAFRLPRLSEIGLAGEPLALARRCALDDGSDLAEDHLAALDAAWGEADPAAEIALDLVCPACGTPITAQADLALFVARDLDLKVRGLLAEVHGFARAYGWTEVEVLAVPPARRRAYAALIGGQT